MYACLLVVKGFSCLHPSQLMLLQLSWWTHGYLSFRVIGQRGCRNLCVHCGLPSIPGTTSLKGKACLEFYYMIVHAWNSPRGLCRKLWWKPNDQIPMYNSTIPIWFHRYYSSFQPANFQEKVICPSSGVKRKLFHGSCAEIATSFEKRNSSNFYAKFVQLLEGNGKPGDQIVRKMQRFTRMLPELKGLSKRVKGV